MNILYNIENIFMNIPESNNAIYIKFEFAKIVQNIVSVNVFQSKSMCKVISFLYNYQSHKYPRIYI